MTIFGWLYLVLIALGAMIKINEVGKPRKPVTSGEAALYVLISSLMTWALYAWGLKQCLN